MSEQYSASEKSQKAISKLTQEKHLLRTRLDILKREDNPTSKSREQARRAQQIADISSRITVIDQEVRQEKYFLARAEDKPIDELCKLFEDLPVGEEKKEKSFGGLEKFINLTSEMVFHTPTKEEEKRGVETVTTSVATIQTPEEKTPSHESASTANNEPFVAITSVEAQKVSFSNINESNIDMDGAKSLAHSSTPKLSTSKADVRPTSIHGSRVISSAFEFPPTYENPDARAARLEKEQFLKNEFDKKMELESNTNNRQLKNTGTIPKLQFNPNIPRNYFDLDMELLRGEL